jgi:hypothetical protein
MAIQMDEHEAGTRNTGSVELLALSPREWRISDTSMPVGDAGSVLGFAERVCDGRYPSASATAAMRCCGWGTAVASNG